MGKEGTTILHPRRGVNLFETPFDQALRRFTKNESPAGAGLSGDHFAVFFFVGGSWTSR